MKISSLKAALVAATKLVPTDSVVIEIRSGLLTIHALDKGAHAAVCVGEVSSDDIKSTAQRKVLAGLMSGDGVSGDEVVSFKKVAKGLQIKFGGIKAVLTQGEDLDIRDQTARAVSLGSYPGAEIRKGIESVVEFAADKKDTRTVLKGVHVGIENGVMTLVAASGHQMAEVITAMPADLAAIRGDIIVPEEFAEGLAKVLTTEPIELIMLMDDQDGAVARLMRFKAPSFQLTVPLWAGQFPDYRRVFSAENTMTLKVELDRKHFVSAITRIGLLSSAVWVKIDPENGRVVVTSSEEDEESCESIDATSVGQWSGEICALFSPALLASTVAGANTEMVTLSADPLLKAQSPIVVRGKDRDNWRSMCMPRRS